jgi:hypothetical protein
MWGAAVHVGEQGYNLARNPRLIADSIIMLLE